MSRGHARDHQTHSADVRQEYERVLAGGLPHQSM